MSAPVISAPTITAKDRAKVERVLAVIAEHRGKANPIRGRVVAERTEVSERDVQEIVKYLGEECSVPIGSKTSAPWGYYIVVDEAELRANYEQLKRRAASTWKHAKSFLTPSVVGPIVGQAQIEEKR
jgi:hypothetical protein